MEVELFIIYFYSGNSFLNFSPLFQSDQKIQRWQKLLYQKIDKTIAITGCHAALGVPTKGEVVKCVMTLSKVMHGIYLVSDPNDAQDGFLALFEIDL